ncbi:hypothetical protein TSOC_007269 [Tetrabaena socialis]|uniref:Ankyrin repeat domain-containing protein n=1 Tax=Tetrabaena socialis TaxID=47790 RepID=A0A2J8A1G2_9CHLO|nr:hypothetical protein TSOC_007269 [Tetrabaena socialis]|eukprot:PNH06361.1 hypothetical protein TSOC_007269 [Tetrabaena socialis]
MVPDSSGCGPAEGPAGDPAEQHDSMLLSLPVDLLPAILTIVPGGSPGVDGGAPCACRALRAAWQDSVDGIMACAQSAVAKLLEKHRASADAGSIYELPPQQLLGRQVMRGDLPGGGGLFPRVLCWAAVELAARGGRPLPAQAASLLRLAAKHADADLLRAVLRCRAMPLSMHDSRDLVHMLQVAAGAGAGRCGAVLAVLLEAGVGAGPEHLAARSWALRQAVAAEDEQSARLLLASGAHIKHAMWHAVERQQCASELCSAEAA